MDTGGDGNSRQSDSESFGSVLRKVNLESYADILKDDGGMACARDLFEVKPEHLAQIFKNEMIFYKVWKGIKILCGVGFCPHARAVKYASLDNFLARVGAADYAHDFHSECVQMDDLIHLDPTEIQKLVPEVGPRGRIIRGLKTLRFQVQQAADEWKTKDQSDDDWSDQENKKEKDKRVQIQTVSKKGAWEKLQWDDWGKGVNQDGNQAKQDAWDVDWDWDSEVTQRGKLYEEDWYGAENWYEKGEESAMDVMDWGKASSIEPDDEGEDDAVTGSSQRQRRASGLEDWGEGEGDGDGSAW